MLWTDLCLTLASWLGNLREGKSGWATVHTSVGGKLMTGQVMPPPHPHHTSSNRPSALPQTLYLLSEAFSRPTPQTPSTKRSNPQPQVRVRQKPMPIKPTSPPPPPAPRSLEDEIASAVEDYVASSVPWQLHPPPNTETPYRLVEIITVDACMERLPVFCRPACVERWHTADP